MELRKETGGKASVSVQWGDALMYKTLLTAVPHTTALPMKVQRAWYLGCMALHSHQP